jgi:hypothetical protein
LEVHQKRVHPAASHDRSGFPWRSRDGQPRTRSNAWTLLSATYRRELASFAFVGEVVLMVWLPVFAVRSGSNQMINR